MKILAKTALIALGLTSSIAFAAPIPDEIYQPARAKVVKADRKGGGEFEAEFRLKGNDVRPIAKKVIRHAKDEGFRLVESDIKRDDADLKFERGDQELDVQIELKDNGRIEYKADLDLDKR